ncbi:MAG: RluA family pseudouridine synthase [Planctomycetota bacterium]|jgi:23S rRNA pseudouridine1911/1915/1917 synthase|nr:RluA family pseudouridine synthase [Planctomycetota bacterium]
MPRPLPERKRRRGQRDLSLPYQEWRFDVGQPEHGQRLDSFLNGRLDWRSRTGIQQIIEEGAVEVLPNKDPQQAEIGRIRTGLRLRWGQEVVVRLDAPGSENQQPVEEGVDPTGLEVLYEDDHVVAVSKPPALNVHPSHGHLLDSVIQRIHIRHTALFGKTRDMPTLCHRLDRETTGLILAAKDQMSRTRLGRQFEARSVKKAYMAVVVGELPEDEGVIELPLGKDFSSEVRLRIGVQDDGEGWPSETRWKVRKRWSDRTLVELYPQTGRQHQLRVHMAAIGFPILGDKLYLGGDAVFLRHIQKELTADDLAFLGLDHQALHSWKLAFEHPFTGEPMELEAPLWPSIAALIPN